MELDFYLLLALVLFFAALVHGTIGLGFPMVSTPLLAIFMDLQTAIIYTLIPTLLVNIVSIVSEGNLFEALKKFYPLILFAIIGSAIGTQILINSDSDIFKLLLAFTIFGYLIIDYIKINIVYIKNNQTKAMRVFGFLAGIISGLTNAMAPVLIIYFLESKYSKSEIIQGTNLAFISGKIIQIIMFTSDSAFSMQAFQVSSLSLVVIILALFLGLKIKKKIPFKYYKKILKVILFSIAIMLLLKNFL